MKKKASKVVSNKKEPVQVKWVKDERDKPMKPISQDSVSNTRVEISEWGLHLWNGHRKRLHEHFSLGKTYMSMDGLDII